MVILPHVAGKGVVNEGLELVYLAHTTGTEYGRTAGRLYFAGCMAPQKPAVGRMDGDCRRSAWYHLRGGWTADVCKKHGADDER